MEKLRVKNNLQKLFFKVAAILVAVFQYLT